MLDAMEVETGMMVIYDDNCRGWIDNSFQALDEFWVCDEKTSKTVFKYGPDGQEQGVRSFTAKELKFTGLWSPHIEITKEVLVDDEVLYEITKVSTWEAELEEQTEVPIFVDKEEVKVVIGPGPPMQVKEAQDAVNQHVDSIRAKLEKAARAAPVVKEELAAPVDVKAEPVQVKQEEAESADWAQEVERRAMRALERRQARAKKQGVKEESAEADAKTAEADGKAKADAEESFQRGWKAAWQAAMEMQKKAQSESPKKESALKAQSESPKKESALKADTPAANAEGPADALEGTDRPKAEAAPEADAAKDAAAKAPAAEKSTAASASEDAAKKNPEDAAAKAPEDATAKAPVAEKAPVAPAPQAESSSNKEGAKKIIDWINDQDQFRDLPPLPPSWIRVKKSGSDKIYYVNTRTGAAQFDEPLPEGWTKVKSKSRGIMYYWHEKSGKSQEQIPRVAPSEKSAVSASTESTQGSGAEKAPP